MDPYRYLPFLSRQVMQAWADRQRPPADVAWAPLAKPLSACRVALITTAGIAPRDGRPFDREGERQNPWWGDPSWRCLSNDVTERDVEVCHLHVDRAPIEADLDVAFPLRRLSELAAAGEIGDVAANHYSIMGYILDARDLVTDTAPELAAHLAADGVDIVVLVPV